MNQKKLIINREKFCNGFDKCSICGGKMESINDILIKKVRDATILFHCSNCEILIGRYT